MLGGVGEVDGRWISTRQPFLGLFDVEDRDEQVPS
jgi:hypothetical protein